MSWINDATVETLEDKILKVQERNVAEAKRVRDAYINSDVELDGTLFQVDPVGRDNMRNAIETAGRKKLPVDTSRGWILPDNSIKTVTTATLGDVLDAYSMRMDEAFVAYATWRAGDKMEPFVIGE